MSLVSAPNAIRGNRRPKNEARQIPLEKIKPLIKLLVADGMRLDEVFAGSGLNPAILTQFGQSIEYAQYQRLLDNALLRAPDRCFALRLGEQFYINHDGLLACRVMTCENVEQAMRLLIEYQPLLTHMFQLEFEVRNGFGIFTVLPASEACEPLRFFVEYLFATIYSLGRFCLNASHFEMLLEFSYPDQQFKSPYETFFNNSIRFDAAYNRVLLPEKVLQRPFFLANGQSSSHYDEACRNKVQSINRNMDLRQKVSRLIRQSHWAEVSLQHIARSLCVAPRTLRRQLGELGTSYKQLLEQERKQAAMRLLRSARWTVEQIALELGYQDASSFSRAFKRWYGVSPNQFASIGDS